MAEHFQRAARLLQAMLGEPEADAMIRQALVRSLAYLKPRRFPFSDVSRRFKLLDGVWDYGPAQGLPGDIMSIHSATLERSTQYIPLEKPVSIQEMRRLHFNGTSSGYPEQWAFYGRRFLVYPIPSGDELHNTVLLDYRSDCTRDEATGVPITADATKETNALIREGEGPLLAYAAYWWCMTIQKDPQRGEMYAGVFKTEMDPLQLEADLNDISGAVVEPYW